MAYYDALIAGWNGATQPPAGVTGSPLLGGDTTAQKLAKVQAWTVPNAQPALLSVADIINAIVSTDLLGLTTTQLQILTLLLQSNMGHVNGSPGTTVRAVFQSIFAGKTQTLANLTTLVAPFDGATKPWLFVVDPNLTSPQEMDLPSILSLGLT